MIVYSKKIIQFLNEIKLSLKNILRSELHLRVSGERFYNQNHTASYPMNVVIYNNKSMLGYYDPNFYELGFHECLMHTKKEYLHNIIRHELAHYLCCISFGKNIQSHGREFKLFCQQNNWGEEVSKATICLVGESEVFVVEESAVLRKVQKLMALAESSNKNEAEQAMIKSQQLLLKYNLESQYLNGQDNEKIFLKRILKQKKLDAKLRSIAKILETFFVNVVFNRTGGCIYLEILGTSVNIEIAEYVATYLQNELDVLWDQAQQRANLKGMIAKNSFFIGISIGYCNKINALKREYSNEISNSLMILEKKLIDAKAMVYRRLSKARSSGSYCEESSAVGEFMGRKLNINTGINNGSKKSDALLPFF
jgi:Protein of unknown function (DUF2786)